MQYPDTNSLFQNLGLDHITFNNNNNNNHEGIESYSPIDNTLLTTISKTKSSEYDTAILEAQEAFNFWRTYPAPKRGEFVRQFGLALREKKADLAQLITIETGKPIIEALGEVQEMIDICDFGVGLSRQLYGRTMHSEREGHRMYEQYHPLGVVGIISAFNFPMAVWAWNAVISWVCGNVCVWKPSEKASLCALACQEIVLEVLEKNQLPKGVSHLVIGTKDLGEKIANDRNIVLVSATGSTQMGRSVAVSVAQRLGKSILELGGNNALIITEDADMSLAIPSAVFGAVGTAGQRCTTTRRLIVHKSKLDQVISALKSAYDQIQIGSPLDQNNHIGPLIDTQAVNAFSNAISRAEKQGATIVVQGEVLENKPSDCYVKPAVFLVENQLDIVKEEVFAPILYIIPYSKDLTEAIAIQNDVPQGLSSAIVTQNITKAEYFLSAAGSDCGIANVNIGTSGAEIGGAFGGEKETGGGRESGSDAWKVYMRRQTNTINYTTDLPLAQGIKFDL